MDEQIYVLDEEIMEYPENDYYKCKRAIEAARENLTNEDLDKL